MLKPFVPILAAVCSLFLAGAAAAAGSSYDPLQTFAPLTYLQPVNQYRAANGVRGPGYWQNRADYTINATLDPQRKTLSASEVVTYTNNSPMPLTLLWLQLDQNRYRRDARGNFGGDREPKPDEHTAGYRITSVAVEEHGKFKPAHFMVSDTRMQPLTAHRGKLKLRIAYSYTIPGAFGGRTDWFHTRNGDIFGVAQWYPRLSVYDDLRGWGHAAVSQQRVLSRIRRHHKRVKSATIDPDHVIPDGNRGNDTFTVK